MRRRARGEAKARVREVRSILREHPFRVPEPVKVEKLWKTNVKGGKIAAMQVERANFTFNTQQAGKADKMTGEIANLSSRDFDANAAAAIR